MTSNSRGVVLTTCEIVVFENWNGSTFLPKLEEKIPWRSDESVKNYRVSARPDGRLGRLTDFRVYSLFECTKV